MVDSKLLPHETRCIECKKIQDKEKATACFLRFCPYSPTITSVAALGEVGENLFPEEMKKAG